MAVKTERSGRKEKKKNQFVAVIELQPVSRQCFDIVGWVTGRESGL